MLHVHQLYILIVFTLYINFRYYSVIYFEECNVLVIKFRQFVKKYEENITD